MAFDDSTLADPREPTPGAGVDAIYRPLGFR